MKTKESCTLSATLGVRLASLDTVLVLFARLLRFLETCRVIDIHVEDPISRQYCLSKTILN